MPIAASSWSVGTGQSAYSQQVLCPDLPPRPKRTHVRYVLRHRRVQTVNGSEQYTRPRKVTAHQWTQSWLLHNCSSNAADARLDYIQSFQLMVYRLYFGVISDQNLRPTHLMVHNHIVPPQGECFVNLSYFIHFVLLPFALPTGPRPTLCRRKHVSLSSFVISQRSERKCHLSATTPVIKVILTAELIPDWSAQDTLLDQI